MIFCVMVKFSGPIVKYLFICLVARNQLLFKLHFVEITNVLRGPVGCLFCLHYCVVL